MLQIRSIKKGDGITQMSWTVGNKYAKINEEWKTVRLGDGGKYEMIVYRVYDKGGNIIAEIESCSGVVLLYGSINNLVESK